MVYILLADGFEEIEALEPLDILRRAEIPVKTAGVCGSRATGAHGITVEADILIQDVQPEDMSLLMLPGGPGHAKLDASQAVHRLLEDACSRGIYIASICAAPSIPGKKGMLAGKRATCFPGYEEQLRGAEITGEKVVLDGNMLTGKGAGAAAEFGFKIVEILRDKETADRIRGMMQY